jgi:ferritin-like metal-binding protein YciE
MATKITSLKELLVLKLQALYDIESELIKALPKMAKNATDPELKKAFTMHLEETKNHKTRLEGAFGVVGAKPKKTTSAAIRGLIEDAGWIFKQKMSPEAKDALMVAAAQYVEHYEMAGYGSAIAWAKELEIDEVADILDETLGEEKAADEKLNTLAEDRLNSEAVGGEAEE